LRTEIGEFNLAVGEPVDFAFTLGELYPAAIPLDSQRVSVPPFDFTLQSDPATLGDLQSATLTGGELHVTVDNGLPVAISGNDPPARITVVLLNADTHESIASVIFPEPIAPGEQALQQTLLSGCVVPGRVAVALVGGSPGSTTPVVIDADATIAVTATWRELRASHAVAIIQPQQWTTEFSVSLPETIRLIEAEIRTGRIHYALANYLPLPCQANVVFGDILDAQQNPLEVAALLPEEVRRRRRSTWPATVSGPPTATPCRNSRLW